MTSESEFKALFKICAELQKHILQFHNEFDEVWKEMLDLRKRIDNLGSETPKKRTKTA